MASISAGLHRDAQNSGLHGVFLLDKPAGMSSNLALQKAKRAFGVRKAGHTGSLDPLATGLLPVCLGEATKLAGYLLDADKRYRVTVGLGIQTTTGDAEGEIIARNPVPELTDGLLRTVLAMFTGTISQIPPMYSALKHQGQRLYELARKGVEVERTPRTVTIHHLEVIEKTPDSVTLDVHCSKGTYIRTLAEDLGTAIGCGGHVTELRRTVVDTLSIDNAATLEALANEPADSLGRFVISPACLLSHLPALSLSSDLADYMKQGQPVFVPKVQFGGLVCLFDRQNRLFGVGEVLDDGRVAPRRILNIP